METLQGSRGSRIGNEKPQDPGASSDKVSACSHVNLHVSDLPALK